MRRFALLLLVTAGCLARPEGRHQPAAIGAWPPAGVDVDIVAARVLDQDGDGVSDLVLASAAPTAPAIYVLLGTRSGIGAGYHAQLTTSLPPLALAVGDVSGDAVPDLVTLEQAQSGGRVEAFATTDLVSFAAPWRVETAILSTVSRDHASIDIVDLDGDGNPDFAFGDELRAVIGRTHDTSEAGFNATAFTELPPLSVNFTQPASAFMASASDGGRNLIVVSANATATYAHTRADETFELHQLEHVPFTSHTRCDLDGDGTLDVIGGFGDWATDRPWPDARTVNYDQDPGFGGYGTSLATACDELDGDPAHLVELAKLWTPQDGVQQVEVLPDLALTETPLALSTNRAAVLVKPIPGPLADVMVEGDFDGDGERELLVVARDGSLTCLHVGVDALTLCSP
ncbi:MAG: hypothetical protein K8W52_39130 [Deltaproteobacteria bacterium]|nr:hypothetical protein [Deltaproteobacteria bacterium]